MIISSGASGTDGAFALVPGPRVFLAEGPMPESASAREGGRIFGYIH